MDHVSDLADRLNARREQWNQLAAETGVPYHTFRKIAARKTKNPRYQTVNRLVEKLDEWDSK